MKVTIEVVAAGEPPPSGAPVFVQVQDTALQDTTSTVMAEKRTKVKKPVEGVIAVATLDVPEQSGAYPTIHVHVDSDRDGKVSEGDYITMQSYPCRGGTMRVEVKRV